MAPLDLDPDEEFGWRPALEDIPPLLIGDQPCKPPPELVAIGPPPADATGIQRWNYQLLSTMAYLAVLDETISNETRMKRAAALTAAAARHYPEAARADLRDALVKAKEEMAGRKRARAGAVVEPSVPAGGAKVIPIRR